MTRDFTLSRYEALCKALISSGYRSITCSSTSKDRRWIHSSSCGMTWTEDRRWASDGRNGEGLCDKSDVLFQDDAGGVRIINKKSLSIVKSKIVTKGKYIEVEIDKKVIKILFTMHSLDSMQDYDIPVEKALGYLLFSDEIIKGHGGRFIAHRKLDRYLARVVYEHDMDIITVVTFYISYADRYFKGVMYEDKILC